MNRDDAALITDVVAWFSHAARDLPWRHTSGWGVMVSEFMLQQTPVQRVIGPWHDWMERWPTPSALAAEDVGEAIRAWGRLGYPRRAMRLHASAVAIAVNHGGEVPADLDTLLTLPGVGSYTAAAITSFAHGRSAVVLDTNVRRVLARALEGVEFPANSPTAAERKLATSLKDTADLLDDDSRSGDKEPEDAEPVDRQSEREELSVAAGGYLAGATLAARWAAASMELGALVCRAKDPRCADCPIAERCAWYAAGKPAHRGPARRGQTYAGTDRQVRGRLLEILRAEPDPVPRSRLDLVWADRVQRERALDSLLTDGLVSQPEPGWFTVG